MNYLNRIVGNNAASRTKGILKNSSINCEKDVIIAADDHHDPKTNTRRCKFVSFSHSDETNSPFASSIYYGVKSYLHHFYEPINSDGTDGGNILEDDFEFIIGSSRRRNGRLFGVGMYMGIALLLAGIILMLIGNLIKPEDILVGVERNLRIVDRNAMQFNRNLETCQLGGLITFCVGGIVIVVTLSISAYKREFERLAANKSHHQIIYPTPQVDSNSTPWIRFADTHMVDNRIPVSQEIRAVQTTNITS